MSASQLTFPRFHFDFATRPVLRLCVVERILCEERIINPVPSRQTLINWLEAGKLEGTKVHGAWFVYQDSLEQFVKGLQNAAA